MHDTDTTQDAERLALPLPTKGNKGFLDQPVTLERRHVPIPEWGITVILRELTAEEKQAYEASIVSFDKQGRPKINSKDAALRLIVASAEDENGERFFDGGDVPRLRKQPGALIDRLFRTAKQLSAIDEEEFDRLKNG